MSTIEQDAPVVVNFIGDEPAETDFFTSHTRLASAIASSIEHNSDLKVIGLLGRWGSGKSTATKKIVDRLEASSKNKFSVFTYDAWLHQSDPIRRSFLESLLRFLKSSNNITGSSWDDRLKELNGEIHDTDIVETPTLSADARWFLVSLLPVPVGLALIDLGTIEGAFGKTVSDAAIGTFWLACALVLMPLWVWILHYMIRRPCKNGFAAKSEGFFSKAFWKIVDDEGKPTSLLPLFLNRSVTRTSTKTFRSADPTSLEFGRTFQAIMQEATKDSRRFVIIIDNLDRVAVDEALQMWATIRSFFLATHEAEDVSHEPYHPTVILPIDRHAIEQMFGAEDVPNGGRDRTASFISKTFDVTFEVTEPVASDWRAFLDQQLRACFGEHYKPGWAFWVRRMFEQHRPATQATVTPREINKLVNRIAALFVQWHSEGISVEIMALYVIRGEELDASVLRFLNTVVPGFGRQVSNWKLQLAAVHYGVPVSKAAQVLLEEPIRNAISQFDQREFASLAAIDGFGETFEIVTTALPSTTGGSAADFTVIGNTALLLSSVETQEHMWAKQAWSNLVGGLFDSDGIDKASPDLADRLKCFLPHLPSSQRAAFVDFSATGISNLLSVEKTDIAELRSLVIAANVAVDYAGRHKLELPLFQLRAEPHVFLVRLGSISNPRVANRVQTEANGEELDQAIATMQRSAADHFHVPRAVQTLSTEAGAQIYGGSTLIEWKAVANTAVDIIRNGDSSIETTGSSMRTLGHLIMVEEDVKKQITDLIDDGTAAVRVSAAFNTKSWPVMHTIYALSIWRGHNFSSPDGTNWYTLLAEQPDFAKAVLAALREFLPRTATRWVWASHSAAYGSRPLLDAIILHMLETGDLGMIDVEHIFNNLSDYRAAIPWRLRDRFMDLVEAQCNLWEKIEDASIGEPLHQAALAFSKKGKADDSRVREIVRRQVEGASSDTWTKALKTGAQPFEMATKFLTPDEIRMTANGALHKSLKDGVAFVCSTADRNARDRWFKLALLLAPKTEKALMRELGDALLNAPAKQQLHVLKTGGTEFLKSSAFKEKSDVVEKLVILQLKTRDGRDWLKDNRDEVRSWLQRAPAEHVNGVRSALAAHLSKNVEERRYSADLLLEAWGMR